MSELSTEFSLLTVPAGAWRLDAAGSSVTFQHKSYWGLATVKGTLPVLTGAGTVAPDGTARGTVQIDAAGLDTGNPQRDKHLRSGDFFAVDAHPTIDFTADVVTPLGTSGAQVKGWLTVRGVTRPLTFTADSTVVGDRTVTLAARVEIDRAEFGMTWNRLGMMRGKADIAVSLRFVAA